MVLPPWVINCVWEALLFWALWKRCEDSWPLQSAHIGRHLMSSLWYRSYGPLEEVSNTIPTFMQYTMFIAFGFSPYSNQPLLCILVSLLWCLSDEDTIKSLQPLLLFQQHASLSAKSRFINILSVEFCHHCSVPIIIFSPVVGLVFSCVSCLWKIYNGSEILLIAYQICVEVVTKYTLLMSSLSCTTWAKRFWNLTCILPF